SSWVPRRAEALSCLESPPDRQEVERGRHEVPLASCFAFAAERKAPESHPLLDLGEGPLALRLAVPVQLASPRQSHDPMHALRPRSLRPLRRLALSAHGHDAALAPVAKPAEVLLAAVTGVRQHDVDTLPGVDPRRLDH